jgi:hypothetical protein
MWMWCVAGAAFALAGLVCVGPVAQDVRYHQFADARPCCGVPNVMDVVSNAGFAVVGVFGWEAVAAYPPVLARAWRVFFVAVGAVAWGSAYYHWAPSNARLVWDRLPMTVGFMSLFALVLHDCAGLPTAQLETVLWPAVGAGALSVAYWRAYDDLRPYLVVQYYPLLCMALLLALQAHAAHATLYGGMLGLYAGAKCAEANDRRIYAWTRVLSGHTLKHALATAATGWAVAHL